MLLAVFATACNVTQNANPVTSTGRYARLGALAFEREQLWGRVDQNHWEPVTAADPSSPWVYQMTTDQRPDDLLFRASSDGGRTWGMPRRVCRRGVKVPFQRTIARPGSHFTIRIEQAQNNVPVDDAKFARVAEPPKPPSP